MDVVCVYMCVCVCAYRYDSGKLTDTCGQPSCKRSGQCDIT